MADNSRAAWWQTSNYLPLCSEGNERYALLRIKDLEKRKIKMTPSEELFSQFFNHEGGLVKDMSDFELEHHREELAKIAFEARARLTRVDEERKDRKPKRSEGFTRSVQTDDITSDAINSIKKRQEKMSKTDKLIKSLQENFFMSEEDAIKYVSDINRTSTIYELKNKPAKLETETLDSTKQAASEPLKPVEFNPFLKKIGEKEN